MVESALGMASGLQLLIMAKYRSYPRPMNTISYYCVLQNTIVGKKYHCSKNRPNERHAFLAL
jgi:hypothetical protein